MDIDANQLNQLPALLSIWSLRPEFVQDIWTDVIAFSSSSSCRERMMFLLCHQVIFQSAENFDRFLNDAFLQALSNLTADPIVDVRIKVARLLACFTGMSVLLHQNIRETLTRVAHTTGRNIFSVIRAITEVLKLGYETHSRCFARRSSFRSTSCAATAARYPVAQKRAIGCCEDNRELLSTSSASS